MGGKFFNSSYRESSVKNKKFRQGGSDEPPRVKKNSRKKKKEIKVQFLREAHHWYFNWQGEPGCWELFPCQNIHDGLFWITMGKYEKLRDAHNSLKGHIWFDWVAWRILDKDGNIIDGGLKDA